MKKLNRRKFIRTGIFAAIGLAILDALWLEKFFFETNHFSLSATSLNSIKLLQLSDLHLNKISWRHQKLIRQINELKPDLLTITGDAIDKAENLHLLDQFLQQIDSSISKVAILGNWEYWGKVDMDALNALYQRHNGILLVNANHTFQLKNRSINIIGIDDFLVGEADFLKAVKGIEKTDHTIVLTHCPEHRDIIEQQNSGIAIDLILSGHTHGGQISLLGFAPFKPPGSGKYLAGWYRDASAPFYVSKGFGTSVIPLRFGSRAEISIFSI